MWLNVAKNHSSVVKTFSLAKTILPGWFFPHGIELIFHHSTNTFPCSAQPTKWPVVLLLELLQVHRKGSAHNTHIIILKLITFYDHLDDDFINDVSTTEVEVESVIRLHSLETAICHHSTVLQPVHIHILATYICTDHHTHFSSFSTFLGLDLTAIIRHNLYAEF